ncbi:hypothetical protein [Rosenbergiella collisarenosi]|uniref:hypothetical protein n=1 Tax=Rosenbergiella collisarenosi TaxID=1544695 RepID=UPI001F4DC00C|nr:hypothetical protein [Rosenbergiella collisarenosi]
MPQVEQQNEVIDQPQVNVPAVEQPQKKSEETVKGNQSVAQGGAETPKIAEALDAVTVNQDQLSIAANENIALSAPGSIKIEAPTGFAKPELFQPSDVPHTHGLGQLVCQHSHSLSLPSAYGSLSVKQCVVDKLEQAYSARIQQARSLLQHLGEAAEADVMALFDKYPVTAKHGS